MASSQTPIMNRQTIEAVVERRTSTLDAQEALPCR
jgi:hypothetical protein